MFTYPVLGLVIIFPTIPGESEFLELRTIALPNVFIGK